MSLTPKQEKFCRCVASGMSYKDAYLDSYNCKTDTTAYNESSKLALREDIQDRIQSLIKPLEREAITSVLTERERKKKIINERIEACILKEDDSAIARYLDILNKMDAEYININKNIDEDKTEINNLDTNTLLRLVK